ncbi:sugar nucleotide-binding protein [Streptomyces sp. NPDC054940]
MTGSGTLIIGSGFVGTGIARHLAASGTPVTLASRRRPSTAPESYSARWSALDATDREACDHLITRLLPDNVVLVHGPSDATWCEDHPAEAQQAHAVVAANVASLASHTRIVLISTDNVFDGTSPHNSEATPASPANAYGRAKHRAEEILLAAAPEAVALRVSLVYGHEPADAGKWLNFFAACAHRLLRQESVRVPHDHWTTPVTVDDVAKVTAALLGAVEPLPSILHLGGPDRVTRAAWAAEIAEALGAPPHLVIPVPKAETRYASRPRNACLTSDLLTRLPCMRGTRVLGIQDGAREMAARFHQATTQGS